MLAAAGALLAALRPLNIDFAPSRCASVCMAAPTQQPAQKGVRRVPRFFSRYTLRECLHSRWIDHSQMVRARNFRVRSRRAQPLLKWGSRGAMDSSTPPNLMELRSSYGWCLNDREVRERAFERAPLARSRA